MKKLLQSKHYNKSSGSIRLKLYFTCCEIISKFIEREKDTNKHTVSTLKTMNPMNNEDDFKWNVSIPSHVCLWKHSTPGSSFGVIICATVYKISVDENVDIIFLGSTWEAGF